MTFLSDILHSTFGGMWSCKKFSYTCYRIVYNIWFCLIKLLIENSRRGHEENICMDEIFLQAFISYIFLETTFNSDIFIRMYCYTLRKYDNRNWTFWVLKRGPNVFFFFFSIAEILLQSWIEPLNATAASAHLIQSRSQRAGGNDSQVVVSKEKFPPGTAKGTFHLIGIWFALSWTLIPSPHPATSTRILLYLRTCSDSSK